MRRMVFLALAMLVATPLGAQTLRERFNELFTFGNCGEPLCLDVAAAVHGQHYIPGVTQGENNLLAFLENAIGVSLGNLPFTSASSGVTFRFEGGIPVATSVSPGPVFAERSQTIGQNRFLVGVNLNGISYKDLRGIPLSDLDFRFTHQNVGAEALGDPTFENDVIEVTTDLDFSLIVASFFASYGVTDRVDVGVLVPMVWASLTGTSNATMNQFDQPSPHFFGTDQDRELVATAETDGSAVGIGDVALRVKVNLVQRDDVGFALLGDVRLPTGDDENFLGSGDAAFRALGILSARTGNFSPHVNAGFVSRGGETQTNSAVATVGFDQLLAPWATLAVELVSDFQVGDSPLILPEPVTFTAPTTRVLDITDIPDMSDNLVDASLGFKFVTPQDFRIVANVLLPLSDGGIRPTALWTVGVERTF